MVFEPAPAGTSRTTRKPKAGASRAAKPETGSAEARRTEAAGYAGSTEGQPAHQPVDPSRPSIFESDMLPLTLVSRPTKLDLDPARWDFDGIGNMTVGSIKDVYLPRGRRVFVKARTTRVGPTACLWQATQARPWFPTDVERVRSAPKQNCSGENG